MKKIHLRHHWSWRVMLLRIVINAGVLVLVAVLLPKVYFVQPTTLLNILLMAVVLGLLNAFLKPLLQLLTFSLIFVSYGIVLFAIDTLLLYLLYFLFPQWFAVKSLFWALVGGALIALGGSFLEDLLGIAPPILPEKYADLRKALEGGMPPPLVASALPAAPTSEEPSKTSQSESES